MSPIHHPHDEHLVEYATGAMAEPMAMLLATHLALCPQCRRQIGALEAVGGALLDEVEPVAVSESALTSLLSRLESEPVEMPPESAAATEGDPLLPQPLRGYVGRRLSEVDWQRIGNLRTASLEIGKGEQRTRLMRIEAGAPMPSHTHAGNELTLVLAGGFSDGIGHYLRGDVAVADADIEHQPVADEDGECLCLAVTDAPLKLTGRFARLLNPFLRF
jgi:putative transcriptional regulator